MNLASRTCLLISLICGLVPAAAAAPDPVQLMKKVPKDVAAIMERRGGCNHWAGEYPYDADRRTDIDSALKQLKCRTLDRDEKRIRRTYSKDNFVLEALSAADDAEF